MRAVTITDRTAEGRLLNFDLVNILELLGHDIKDSRWEITDVESVGASSDNLHELSDSRAVVTGEALMQLAKGLDQIIDGKFVGYHNGQNVPWVVIRAVDSAAYDVESNDEEVMRQIKQRFKNVTDIQ